MRFLLLSFCLSLIACGNGNKEDPGQASGPAPGVRYTVTRPDSTMDEVFLRFEDCWVRAGSGTTTFVTTRDSYCTGTEHEQARQLFGESRLTIYRADHQPVGLSFDGSYTDVFMMQRAENFTFATGRDLQPQTEEMLGFFQMLHMKYLGVAPPPPSDDSDDADMPWGPLPEGP